LNKKGILEDFRKKYGKDFVKAYTAVKRKRVMKVIYKDAQQVFWIVYSPYRRRFHLVVSDLFCTCRDFYLNVVLRKKRDYCYHILARKLAEMTGIYETRYLDEKTLQRFIIELYINLKYID